MALFSGPTEHAANPPSTWRVEPSGNGWALTTKDGTVLDRFATRVAADIALTDGPHVAMYDADARWYAGERQTHRAPWEQVRARHAATISRHVMRHRAKVVEQIAHYTAVLRNEQLALTDGEPTTDPEAWLRDWLDNRAIPGDGWTTSRIVKNIGNLDGLRYELGRVEALITDYMLGEGETLEDVPA